ncbi:MAG: STAS domain-containing protein [Bdellovibrionaceae bacterium]|nr:STAS domain-containing protein [Pseudobdellovibrionaceae bacterium]
MSIEVSKNKSWVIFLIKDRLDESNFKEFTSEMDKIVQEKSNPNIALQMSEIEFLSLPTIKYFSVIAEGLVKKGGKFALVGVSEKIKRQIDIFASLKPMLVFRSEEDWESFNP